MYIKTIIAVIFICASLAGEWMILEKMGEKGWKALIPFYSEYLIFKNIWNGKMYAVSLSTAFLASVLFSFVDEAPHVTFAVIFCFIVAFLCSLIAMLVDLILLYKLSKAFGHGIRYAIGLFFAAPVFDMILGFGKSRYADR